MTTNLFNGFYFAPGVLLGNKSTYWDYESKKIVASGTFDIGMMLPLGNQGSLEIFAGSQSQLIPGIVGIIYTTRPRLGLRIGVTI